MERFRLQPDFDSESTQSNNEDILIEMIDLKAKWQGILSHAKSRKWVLSMMMKSGDPDTRLESLFIYLHLYENGDFLGTHETTQTKT